jgi:hypothetical protein
MDEILHVWKNIIVIFSLTVARGSSVERTEIGVIRNNINEDNYFIKLITIWLFFLGDHIVEYLFP